MKLSQNLDCGFVRNKNWFRYRVAAIIIENGCVLMASNDAADYYYSVGGAVCLGETTEEAIVRELFEESGVKYEVDRLAFIHENFFSNSTGRLKGLVCHEVVFYFVIKSKGTQKLSSNNSCLECKEVMNWIPIPDLKNLKVYPTFLAEKLENMPDTIEHIITKE